MAGSTDRPTAPVATSHLRWLPGSPWARLGLLVLALAAVVVLVVAVGPRLGGRLLANGTAAPALVLTGDDGSRIDVRTLAAGRPVVVEFLETTCPTCQAKASEVCALAQGRRDVLVVGVDAALEGADRLRAFRAQRMHGCDAATLPLLVDPDATVSHRYAVTVVPTVYVVDGAWKVAYSGIGAAGLDGVDSALRGLAGAHG